jgi:glycogen debranching enzyme
MRAPIDGIYSADTRVAADVRLEVAGAAPEPIAAERISARTAVFTSLARAADDGAADPRVVVARRRALGSDGFEEVISVANALGHEVEVPVTLSATVGAQSLQRIRAGVPEKPEGDVADAGGGSCVLTASDARADLGAEGAQMEVSGHRVRWSWRLAVPPRGEAHVTWRVRPHAGARAVDGVRGPQAAPAWNGVRVTSSDERLSRWVAAALGDLDALRMTAVAVPDQPFIAAGAPWFFTLFGRDSLWTARFLLPLGTGLAESTLRALAAFQGTRVDTATAEEPGKILHELRAGELVIPGEGITLPPRYYGTIDATPLWICLLHDAWRWGMGEAALGDLLPHLRAALGWMRDHGDSDGDGLLEYVDRSGHGLSNQGWKDSGDSVQWHDGTIARGPIALCEVQAYAHEAAVGGAEILEHVGDEEAARWWRGWAAELRARFRDRFWVERADAAGRTRRFPAIALDADKRPVDSLTSNIGHLLGTGLLDPEEEGAVAGLLAGPDMDSGFGLRTLSALDGGFWPLSYHGGSVWTHDTAISIMGLVRSGHGRGALPLAEGLLAAAEGFGFRVPELHSGEARRASRRPVPYPAACRPQGWSAAAAVAVAGSLLGLEPDREGRRPLVHPVEGAPRISIEGVRWGGESFTVAG